VTIVARETPPAGRHPGWESALERRALALWPRLERRALRRCGHDPTKIAELVARRTSLPPEAIVRILLVPQTTEDEIGTWFG
jgi:hypothetical protein